jgi:hypothetical protein
MWWQRAFGVYSKGKNVHEQRCSEEPGLYTQISAKQIGVFTSRSSTSSLSWGVQLQPNCSTAKPPTSSSHLTASYKVSIGGWLAGHVLESNDKWGHRRHLLTWRLAGTASWTKLPHATTHGTYSAEEYSITISAINLRCQGCCLSPKNRDTIWYWKKAPWLVLQDVRSGFGVG